MVIDQIFKKNSSATNQFSSSTDFVKVEAR